jgi:hypothetical protein
MNSGLLLMVVESGSFAGLQVQRHQDSGVLLHMGEVSLRVVVDRCMLGLAPVPAFGGDETAFFEQAAQAGLVVGGLVIQGGRALLGLDGHLAVERAQHPGQLAGPLVDLDQGLEIRHGQAQHAARGQHPVPLFQHLPGLVAVEILQRMAAVNQRNRVVIEEGQGIDAGLVVDVRHVTQVDMDKARDDPVPATQMDLEQCPSLAHSRLRSASAPT